MWSPHPSSHRTNVGAWTCRMSKQWGEKMGYGQWTQEGTLGLCHHEPWAKPMRWLLSAWEPSSWMECRDWKPSPGSGGMDTPTRSCNHSHCQGPTKGSNMGYLDYPQEDGCGHIPQESTEFGTLKSEDSLSQQVYWRGETKIFQLRSWRSGHSYFYFNL